MHTGKDGKENFSLFVTMYMYIVKKIHVCKTLLVPTKDIREVRLCSTEQISDSLIIH